MTPVAPETSLAASLPARARLARRWLGPVFDLLLSGVLVQAALAGLSVFVDPRYWAHHTTFVHAFDWLGVVAVGATFVARSHRRVKLLAGATLLLILLLYVSAGLDPAHGLRPLAAAHPVLALLLFWAAATGARLARQEHRGTPAG